MELIIASIVAFAGTNIDDLFILMLFFGNRSYKTKDIVTGQFIGVGLLIAVSLTGSIAGLWIHKSYIGLLGLLPIFLGIKGLIKLFGKKDENDQSTEIKPRGRNAAFNVAAVTFANGGDNIGIYIPLFATLSNSGKIGMICIFTIMIGLWCLIGKYLSQHAAIARGIYKYGHIVTPVVLILLGCYILYESGSYTLIRRMQPSAH